MTDQDSSAKNEDLEHNLDPAGQIQFSGSKSSSAQLFHVINSIHIYN